MQGHQPRKRFGQNFLADAHYVAKIVAAIAPAPGDNIVEIGPGLGALTGALVDGAGRIAAIEIDRDLAARLRDRFAAEVLALHEADALAFDFGMLGPDLRVVGNLPYNISSPLLFHLGAYAASVRDIHVMLQREVVARMTAAPATPDYGRLTVTLQCRFAVTRLFIVPPGAFRPAPNVDSAVARLVPLRDQRPRIADEPLFARVFPMRCRHSGEGEHRFNNQLESLRTWRIDSELATTSRGIQRPVASAARSSRSIRVIST